MEFQFEWCGNSKLLVNYVSATLAIVFSFAGLSNSQKSAHIANMNPESIWNSEQSFLQKIAHSMGNDTVSLHLSKSQSSWPSPSVSGLSCEGDYYSSASSIHLIIDEVAQTLVVDRPDKYQILKWFACVGIEHLLVSITLISSLVKLSALLYHVEIAERSCVFRNMTLNRCNLWSQTLD
jgi:hypothetical protein